MDPLASSKTNRLLYLDAALFVLLVAVGVAVVVLWGKDVTTLVLGALGIRGGTTTVGIARNIVVDGPIRRAASMWPPSDTPDSPPRGDGGP